MVVDPGFTYDKRQFSSLYALTSGFDSIAYRAFKDAAKRTEKRKRNRLTRYPSRKRFQGPWTSARQRRAFFATGGFGRGIPTRRTSGLKRSWRFEIARSGGNFTFSIGNTAPSARFVIGTLDVNNFRAAGRAIQQFHLNAGWTNKAPEVRQVLLAANDEFESELSDTIKRETGLKPGRQF